MARYRISGNKSAELIRLHRRFAAMRRPGTGERSFMSLAVSSRELKIRPRLVDIIFGTLTGACLLAGCGWSLVAVSAASAASVTPAAAEKGMVVSAQHLATEVGVDILKRGGSAIDAAVAVGYALAVVYPAAGNLGGGGFMTIWFADGRKTFLDFREKAPRAASRDMYLDKDGNVIKGLTTTGWLAVGVPGTVSGLEYAREKYGTMTRAALIEPAIEKITCENSRRPSFCSFSRI